MSKFINKFFKTLLMICEIFLINFITIGGVCLIVSLIVIGAIAIIAFLCKFLAPLGFFGFVLAIIFLAIIVKTIVDVAVEFDW